MTEKARRHKEIPPSPPPPLGLSRFNTKRKAERHKIFLFTIAREKLPPPRSSIYTHVSLYEFTFLPSRSSPSSAEYVASANFFFNADRTFLEAQLAGRPRSVNAIPRFSRRRMTEKSDSSEEAALTMPKLCVRE